MSETTEHRDGNKIREAAEPYTNRTGQSLGDVFETLAARRRRYVLYYLNDHPEAETTLYELVDLIIAWETYDRNSLAADPSPAGCGLASQLSLTSTLRHRANRIRRRDSQISGER